MRTSGSLAAFRCYPESFRTKRSTARSDSPRDTTTLGRIAPAALDLADWFGVFFVDDGTLELPASGFVNGAEPNFHQMGDAAAWNSGLDRSGNAYTVSDALLTVAP